VKEIERLMQKLKLDKEILAKQDTAEDGVAALRRIPKSQTLPCVDDEAAN
jgi:hypothetical protein